jgi:hypothetical protein
MKKVLLLLILTAEVTSVYPQGYDLIVKTNDDSIACKIDSISDVSIYFKMKSYNHWVHTLLDRNEVTEYKYNAIELKDYVYKPGTSYILSVTNSVYSIYDTRKNSIYVGYYILALSVNYDRIIPVANGIGILAGAGFISSFFESSGTPNPFVKPGIILGDGKHFFEGGLFISLMNKHEDFDFIMPELGYRYQGPRGFLFRADIATSADVSLILGVSLGYSF